MRRSLAVTFALSVVLLSQVQGCTSQGRLPAVPPADLTMAFVPGIPKARYLVDADIEPFVQDAVAAGQRERAYLARTGHRGPPPPASILAISGGGGDGAFGAGLLVGWTRAGTRPEFKVVTGVSTGALTAPFAFLGSAEDETLRAVYTTTGPSDIFKWRLPLVGLFSDGMADNRPLYDLISRYVDAGFLERVAKEYREKGRMLLIGTTNLDARRPVIWNMGEIAASGEPGALDLFRRIMVASAAIPAAFPPTMIDVEANGRRLQEMHVDGGTQTQVFIYPPGLFDAVRSVDQRSMRRPRSVYVIRNARLDPDWASVGRGTLGIARRAILSLIHTQGMGDLLRIYLTARQDGLDFHLAYIGADFQAPRAEDFDTAYMRALFEYAYRLASNGYPWQETPPGVGVSTCQSAPTVKGRAVGKERH